MSNGAMDRYEIPRDRSVIDHGCDNGGVQEPIENRVGEIDCLGWTGEGLNVVDPGAGEGRLHVWMPGCSDSKSFISH